MSYCYDVVYGFVKICVEVIDCVNEIGDLLVLIFGKVILKFNIVNVVFGEVEFIIDCCYIDVVFL